ncbi:MAG: endonuclease/exonuclease/phosphatase family protein [Acidobacteriota bacterium]|nr:endonuclease/exonuclease/phosphatase family protein [Acidobacteriota bacterium]MDE3264299.1 endonuclease/exonuclease/phosphatase family protein [Acidobacteriota bacterium]
MEGRLAGFGRLSRCLMTGIVVTSAYPGAVLGQEAVHEIHEIQGRGLSSSRAGMMVTTNDNVVTAVGAGGFFIQTPSARSDDDADTSDGVFVLHGGEPPVNVGDQVDVHGAVEEYFGFTRIDATVAAGSVSVDAGNQPLPAAVEFNASRPSPDPASPSCRREYECYEGMRIRIATGTVSSGSQRFGSDPVAEMYITPTASRGFREPGIEYPGRPGLPVWDGNPEVFELDPDKLGLSNVSWVPGTVFTATGVLGYEFGGYEMWPTELRIRSEAEALPRAVRAQAPGEITVASQNLLNLRENAGSTKLGKLSRLIREVLGSPDIVAVQETLGQPALRNLASRIRSDDSNVRYTVHFGATGGFQSVGFLVRSGVTVGRVTEHGRSETFVDPRDGTIDRLHDRPPVVLEATAGGLAFTVVVVHNRSLIDVDDAARGEWVRTKRLEQAQSVARLVESLQDSRLIVLGDFNAFQFTDGYVDVVGQIRGRVTLGENLMSGPDLVTRDLCNLIDRVPDSERYSFVFGGNAQVLDHALVNQSLEPHVVGIEYARGNSDAARHNEDDATNALFAADHDGLVVYLSSDARPPVEPSPCEASTPRPSPDPEPPPDSEPPPPEPPDVGDCGDEDVLCVGNFDIQVEWRTSDGRTGRGMAEKLTAESGYFWFFEPANIEMVIKVLDGCAIDGHFWVFGAGLTDVEVTTTVRDRRNGARKTWVNPLGRLFEPIRDTETFDGCDSPPLGSYSGVYQIGDV